MSITKCLLCGDNITQSEGKRQKVYCSDLCRAKYWQNKNPKSKKTHPQELHICQSVDCMSLKAENQRLIRLNEELMAQLQDIQKAPVITLQSSPSGIVPIGQKIEAAKAKIRATTWSGDLQKVAKEIKAENLPGWAQKQIEAFMNEHRLTFTN